MSYNISSSHIKDMLLREEIFDAILETSAILEEIFFQRMVQNENIPIKLISGWSLGKLIQASKDLGIIVEYERFYPILKDFNTLRNYCVHSGKYLISNLNESQRHGVCNLIADICEFIPKNIINEDLKDPNRTVHEEYMKKIQKQLEFLDKFS